MDLERLTTNILQFVIKKFGLLYCNFFKTWVGSGFTKKFKSGFNDKDPEHQNKEILVKAKRCQIFHKRGR
jgi:hypothetical protein